MVENYRKDLTAPTGDRAGFRLLRKVRRADGVEVVLSECLDDRRLTRITSSHGGRILEDVLYLNGQAVCADAA